jgi:hypothetical protein
MSKKKRFPRRDAPGFVDRSGDFYLFRMGNQLYAHLATGQMARVDPHGRQVSRIRMSKKERLRLRKELHRINEMDSHELANKIVEDVASVSAINPKAEEQLKSERGEIARHA